MAWTDDTFIPMEPIGAGLTGTMITKSATLDAATDKKVYFGPLKLSDVAHVNVLFPSSFTNGDSDTVIGAPDTTIEVHSSGEYLTLKDGSGGKCMVTVAGKFTYR